MSTTPTVYFIDDSATMREVIKIAFRRENINVVAYNDAASALGNIEQSRPDVVITDVIMPDKDGYEVCSYIKSHPSLGHTPVILMSGVVNKAVAEKAFAVKADELIRKPFQPQDLITRVKHLLQPGAVPAPQPSTSSAAATLSSIFQQPSTGLPMPTTRPRIVPPPAQVAPTGPYVTQPPVAYPPQQHAAVVQQFAQPVATVPAAVQQVSATAPVTMPHRPAPIGGSAMSTSSDVQKLRIEVMRLEGLVRKLQSELAAEREYARALEEHVKTLQEND